MSEEKTVFVSEETWKEIVEKLGYEPENLKATNLVPKNQAIVMDNEKLKTPFFKAYQPFKYFNS